MVSHARGYQIGGVYLVRQFEDEELKLLRMAEGGNFSETSIEVLRRWGKERLIEILANEDYQKLQEKNIQIQERNNQLREYRKEYDKLSTLLETNQRKVSKLDKIHSNILHRLFSRTKTLREEELELVSLRGMVDELSSKRKVLINETYNQYGRRIDEVVQVYGEENLRGCKQTEIGYVRLSISGREVLNPPKYEPPEREPSPDEEPYDSLRSR